MKFPLLLQAGKLKCFIVLIFFHLVEGFNYEISLERIEPILGDKETLVDFRSLKVVRNKKDYVISGNFTFKMDMDHKHKVDVKTAYSALGNNQFTEQPFGMPKTSFCVYLNTTHKRYPEPIFEGKWNIPKIPTEGMCPFPKGTYYIENAQIPTDTLVNNLPEGLWKLEARAYLDSECIGGLRVLARVNKKYY